MIFPTEELLTLRDQLEDRINRGEIDEAEAYREALAADPEDPRALRLLALLAEEQGDLATADSLAWRWLRADPLSHEVFRLIGRLLAGDPSQAARSAAYTALGNQKLHFDPEAHAEHPVEAPPPPSGEPEEVTREMEPHRLLHSMWTASTDEVDRSLVDRMIAQGANLAPLLRGVLNLFAEDLLDEVDDALAIRALALLGETGGPAHLGTLLPFTGMSDDSFSEVGGWAYRRILLRNPEASWERIRHLIAAAMEASELGSIAEQAAKSAGGPERLEMLELIAARIPEFEGLDRGLVATAVLLGGMMVQGAGSELAARVEKQFARSLPPEIKRELKDARRELRKLGPISPEPENISVYDLCCPQFEAAEEDEPYIRSEPKVGRNDPCWCGSGKKYKKCHLAADEGC